MNDQNARAMREATETVLRELGQKFYVRRGEVTDEVVGRRDARKRLIMLAGHTVVHEGDIFTCPTSGDELIITNVDRTVVGPIAVKTTAEYETPKQREQRLADERRRSTPSFSIGPGATFQGSIVGTQQHAQLTASFDQRAIEAEIERRGGEDVDALKAMVAEIREMLDDSNKISRGSLVHYSELLERHSWIAGALAQTMIGWLVSSFKP